MPTPPKAKPVTLDVYLQYNGISLEGTYLHVIRDPNASRDWVWAMERSDLSHPESLTAALIQVTRFDTCHNRASLWTLAKRVVVLIDVAVRVMYHDTAFWGCPTGIRTGRCETSSGTA